MRFSVPIALLLAATALPTAAQNAPLYAKDVAAPPSDILTGIVRLPEVADLGVESRTALLPVVFAADVEGRMVFRTELPLERVGALSLVALAGDSPRWRMSVRVPGLPAAPLHELARAGFVTRRTAEIFDLFPGLVADQYDLPVVPAERIEIEIVAPPDAARAGGHLLIATAGSMRLASTVSTLQTLTDQPVAVTARVFDAGDDRNGTIDDAKLHVRIDGQSVVATMRDDGLHGDDLPGDGTFGAWMPFGLSGKAQARVTARGTTATGGGFLLSAHHTLDMLPRAAVLTGELSTRVRDRTRLALRLGVQRLDPQAKLLVGAEVWGADAAGDMVPVCWLGKMIAPAEPVELVLDGRWLNRANVAGALELREVRLQDPDTSVPYDIVARLVVPNDTLPRVIGEAPAAITRAMRMGIRPALAQGPQATGVGFFAAVDERIDARSDPALMLTHGYCSGGSIWPAAEFSQPKLEFLDPNQNRTHDEFALLLRAFGSRRTSFGVVAHSQGGMAALHLYNYYWSGLDLAQGPRRIQALAAPFAGTPLAALGDLGPCGANNDMTPEGSTTWLAGIPSSSRAEVFYWTTSEGGFFSCIPLIGLLLSSPNDGTVEQFRGQLAGGHNMGHRTGWCHTTGMQDPASYTDATRNAEMNAQAAR